MTVGSFAATLGSTGKMMSSKESILDDRDEVHFSSVCRSIKRGRSGDNIDCYFAATGA